MLREKITGTTADRPHLAKLMKKPAPSDVVITAAVDRLPRGTTDLLVITRDMQRAGAGIRSLAEPFLNATSDFPKIVLSVLGGAANLAKVNGVKFRRKPNLTPHQQKEACARLEAGEPQRSPARSYNVNRSTISRPST